MVDGDRSPDDLLLDLHLGRMDEQDRAWLASELLRDTTLRAKSDRLGALLRPLDHWTVPAPPANLADKVLTSIRRTEEDEQPSVLPITEEASYSRPSLGSFRQVVAVAACIIALVGVVGPGLSEVRARSHRARCASNLGSIFRGTTLYQQAFGGSLPFAGCEPDAAWLPGSGTDRPYRSNSRHIFLIAKLNYGPQPKDFVCPSNGDDRPMRVDGLADYDDFKTARNISYGSLNLAGRRPNLRPPMPIPYMSDPNPLFVNASFNSAVDPNRTNTRAHRGKCQRVLILDGSVIRLTVPVFGPNRDNFWLAGKIRRYVGTETPTADNDAFLIPGYPTTDPLVQQKTRY
ncbi:MAG: hypothetical protein JSU63_21645 [Phycisphaerales bacterium]|nr:MAG: hypothetical protein JSU63_21645 [Phycisphaerales bacterium]